MRNFEYTAQTTGRYNRSFLNAKCPGGRTLIAGHAAHFPSETGGYPEHRLSHYTGRDRVGFTDRWLSIKGRSELNP
jgi:hypothetical protein